MSDAPRDRDTLLHRPPLLRDVAAEQLRVVGLAVRREATATAALLAAISILTLSYAWRIGETLSFDGVDDVAGLALLAAAVALVAPMAVWKGEERFGSSPLWFLPVDHRRHALLKVGAGWAWLMVAVAAAILWIFLLTRLGGGRFGAGEAVFVLGAPEISGARSIVWTTPWWQWAAVSTGATAAYLLGSAFLIGTRHPWKWLVGMSLGLFLLVMLVDALQWRTGPFDLVMERLVLGRYGADVLLTGGTETLETAARLPSGEAVMAWRRLPSAGEWALATLLWNGIGLAALVAAASRRRDG